MSYDFETRICGIPCLIRYDVLGDYHPATMWEPESHPELEWQVLDTRGRPALWLERKMTIKDDKALTDECWEHYEGECEAAQESLAEYQYERRYG